MFNTDYIQSHLSAAAQIMATANGEALSRMDLSIDGFWRSFQAIFLALPPMILVWVAAAPDFFANGAQLSSIALRLGISDILTWLVPLLGLALVSRSIGIADRFVAYVIATNWASAMLVWLAVPPALAEIFLPGQDNISSMLSLVAFIISLVMGWRVTHGALAREAGFSTGVFVAVIMTSVLVQFGCYELLGLTLNR